MTFDLDVAYPGLGLVDFWKSLFPNWPDELINKFSQGISIDAPKFGFAGGGDISGFQAWWGAVVSPPAQATYSMPLTMFQEPVLTINLLSPQNPRFTVQSRWDIGFWYLPALSGSGFFPNFPQAFQNNMNTQYMPSFWGRQPVTGHVYINYDSRLYYNNFQWNYSTYGVLSSVDNDYLGTIANYATTFNVAPNASATPYQFVDTILALHENKADNGGINYGLLYDYQTYRDAYLKYGSQIASKVDLLRQQSAADVAAYKQDYSDRAQREINDLATKKFQILQAIDNEKKSAMRDYQSQLLTAQNLKLTLQNTLNG